MPLRRSHASTRLRSMKFVRAAIAWWLLGAGAALAQVSVQVELNQEQYLAREPIQAAVRVVNFSGVPLRLGRTPDWLQIDVEATDGSYVERVMDPPVVHEFTVPNAARGTRYVDLVPYFKILDIGRYKVTATVRIPELSMQIKSPPAYFNIIGGATVWDQAFGWRPVIDGRPREVVFRRYQLVQAMDGRTIALYARVQSADGSEPLAVVRLGRYLTFSHPKAMVDRASHLHVLWQTGSQFFTYVELTPQGRLVRRQTHQYVGTKPTLQAMPDGGVKVVGGLRVPSSDDYPPPKEQPEEDLTLPRGPERPSGGGAPQESAAPEQQPAVPGAAGPTTSADPEGS